MTERTACGGLQVATELYRFVNEEAIPGTGIDETKFWAGVGALIHELAPINRELVAQRDVIKRKSTNITKLGKVSRMILQTTRLFAGHRILTTRTSKCNRFDRLR